MRLAHLDEIILIESMNVQRLVGSILAEWEGLPDPNRPEPPVILKKTEVEADGESRDLHRPDRR